MEREVESGGEIESQNPFHMNIVTRCHHMDPANLCSFTPMQVHRHTQDWLEGAGHPWMKTFKDGMAAMINQEGILSCQLFSWYVVKFAQGTVGSHFLPTVAVRAAVPSYIISSLIEWNVNKAPSDSTQLTAFTSTKSKGDSLQLRAAILICDRLCESSMPLRALVYRKTLTPRGWE